MSNDKTDESTAKKMKLTEESSEISPKHCHHFVKRKKRFCKMIVGKF